MEIQKAIAIHKLSSDKIMEEKLKEFEEKMEVANTVYLRKIEEGQIELENIKIEALERVSFAY